MQRLAVVAVAWCIVVGGGVHGFVTVGEANMCANSNTLATVSDGVNATSPAAVVEYADCSTEVVEVVTDSDGNTQLGLSGKQIAYVKSLPVVAKLDLSNNSIAALENASIPSAVQTLDLSRNPFSSMQHFEFPASLTKLTATSGKLATLQNFSFPNTVSTLNFSSNPITQISGVIFPSSLKVLLVTSTVGLKEFEVRQTDAVFFANLDVFNISTITDVTCKDSDAMIRYVQETLLCVLPDEAFDNKYGVKGEESTGGSLGGEVTTLAPELQSSITQRRSKFLILSAVSLALAFVALLVLLAMRNIHDRVERGRRTRLPRVYHPVLPSKKTWWEEDKI